MHISRQRDNLLPYSIEKGKCYAVSRLEAFLFSLFPSIPLHYMLFYVILSHSTLKLHSLSLKF